MLQLVKVVEGGNNMPPPPKKKKLPHVKDIADQIILLF
jgi:hypothetical protein